MTAPITVTDKPPYFEAFDLIAGLPPEVSPSIIAVLTWVWRHTNSNPIHENYGKAWKSQSNLAREMHVSDKTVQRAFDHAWSWGFISREHLFKKNGQVIVSSAPYEKAASKGLGEYQHARYWINWDFLRQIGVVTESTPNENGVVTESTPTANGVDSKSNWGGRRVHRGVDLGVSLTSPASETAVGVAAGDDGKAGVDAEEPSTATASLVVVGNRNGAGNERLNPANQNRAEREERAEQLISSAHRKRISRDATDEEIFREYDSVWKQLQREREAKDNFEPQGFDDPSDPRAAGLVFDKVGRQKYAMNPVWEAMPEGADWEGSLRTNKKQRHDAADLYRALGQAAALAKWKDFLVNTDPEIKARVPIFDDDNMPTGKCAPTDEQIAWPLREFVLRHGISVMETKS